MKLLVSIYHYWAHYSLCRPRSGISYNRKCSYGRRPISTVLFI